MAYIDVGSVNRSGGTVYVSKGKTYVRTDNETIEVPQTATVGGVNNTITLTLPYGSTAEPTVTKQPVVEQPTQVTPTQPQLDVNKFISQRGVSFMGAGGGYYTTTAQYTPSVAVARTDVYSNVVNQGRTMDIRKEFKPKGVSFMGGGGGYILSTGQVTNREDFARLDASVMNVGYNVPEKVYKREKFGEWVATKPYGYETGSITREEYYATRQVFLANVKQREFSFTRDVSKVAIKLSPVYYFDKIIYGKSQLEGKKVFGVELYPEDTAGGYWLEQASVGALKKEEIGKGLDAVQTYYEMKGYDYQTAFKKTEMTFERFKGDVGAEMVEEVGVGIVSNTIGGFAVAGAVKVAGATGFLTKTPTIAYWTTKTLGMGPAGTYEGINFGSARKRYIYHESMTTTDYLVYGGVGAVSSVFAQVFIEKGITGAFKPNVATPMKMTSPMSVREKFLYATDLLEPVSDAFSTFISSIPRQRVFTFPLTMTNTKSNTYSKTDSKPLFTYESPTLGKRFTFIRTQNFAKVETTPLNSKTLIRTQTNPLIQTQSKPSVFNNPETKTLPVVQTPSTITKTQISSFVQTKTQPQVSPFANVLPTPMPEVIPFPNVFVGGVAPFIPPMGGGYGKDVGFNVRTKQRKAYIPSLTAIGFNIKAKKSRRIDVLSGLSVRPVLR